MKTIHKLINMLFAIAGVLLIGTNVWHFNNADTWLELFRSLLWIIAGAACFWQSIYRLEHDEKWYE